MEKIKSNSFLTKENLTKIRVLLISDTHANEIQFTKILTHIVQKHIEFDIIFILGDFSNIQSDEHIDPHKENLALNDAKNALEFFKLKLKKPILFIPGNHEANILYSPGGLSSENAINLHKNNVELIQNLKVFGFGGAPPGVLEEEKGEWVKVWEGYPQETHEKFDKEITEFLENEVKKCNPDSQIILLTHTGPFDIQTCITPKAYAGSKAIQDFLEKYNKRIICNLHGHSHGSPGMVRYFDSDCLVINPGPLCFGNACDIILEMKESKWKISEANFIIL